MFKKLLTGALALTLTMGSAALPETSFGDALNIVHAESESTAYTISDVENLLMTVPKYFEYYSEESTKDLKSVLAELDKVNLEDCSQEEIDYYYENISAGLNELEFKTAEVPQVYISTANDNGNTIQKTDDYVDTAIAIVDTDGKALTEYAGKIKVRGNSTAKAPKKAFNIKFSSKQNVLGMGKAKKWSLLANCYDPTLLRNYVALDFAQHMGLAYTSEKKIVELWVDGIFKGCYLLAESVEAGKTRVDIDTEGNKDFMIEYEAVRVEEDKTYIVSNGFRFALSEPEEPTEEQFNYITEILDEITGAIKTKDINEYGKYIDLESFAKYYMLNEFYKTVDFSNSSVYYYYKDGKLYAGPAWDYDLSSGNAYADYSAGYNQLSQSSAINANKQFYEDLYKSQDFLKIVWDYYVEYHDYIKQIYIPGGLIDTLVKDNAEVIKRNFTDAGWDVSYKYNICMRNPDATYEENLDFYKNWLFERDKWLLKFWRIQRNVDCYYNSEHVCEYCGANHQHTFGSWEITKEPTCTTEGIKTRNCTSCLEVETQTIPKKEHNFIATIVKPTYEAQGYTLHKCSVCGEEYKDNNTAKLVVPTVTGLKVAATSAQAVKLTCNKVAGATGYVFYRAISGKWVRVGVTKTNAFYEGKLNSGTSYRYAVKAYKTVNGNNYYSSSYPTLWTSTNPATVNFTLTAGSKKAVVKWTKTTGATGYIVYMKTSAKASWQKIATTKSLSYTKTGLVKGKTYWFTVKAYRTVNGNTYNGKFVTMSVKVK